MRILCNHGFFGLLLMHMKFAVDEKEKTAYTDGERIVFGTKFLDDLSDSELDFVMMHEIMHVILNHCFRDGKRDSEIFNVACDIVVNSNILYENKMNLGTITLKKYGEAMHTLPKGDEGYKYTAEEVYGVLTSKSTASREFLKDVLGDREGEGAVWDNHNKWGEGSGNSKISELRDAWRNRVKEAAEATAYRESLNGRGNMPLLVQRVLEELRAPQTNWRMILNDFVQEDITDYSFCPPDRRFSEGDFFLPDFNEKEDEVKDILFMIDTSGSMSDSEITAAYSEIKGAIEQFNGRLEGWLGFFDADVVPPKSFSSIEELKIIRPKGGGGTSFESIFNYVNTKMDTPPASIIILTDGYAPIPPEKAARDIPVLWIINNAQVTPSWGTVARIS